MSSKSHHMSWSIIEIIIETGKIEIIAFLNLFNILSLFIILEYFRKYWLSHKSSESHLELIILF